MVATKLTIHDLSAQLVPAKGKGKYICPACGQPKMWIAKNSPSFGCYGCNDTKEIWHILAPPELQQQRQIQEAQQLANSKTRQERLDEWQKDSAVNQKITEANLRHIEDATAIARLLNWSWYSGTPGWYVTSCHPITGMRTKKGQFKPDVPITRADEKNPQKYITFPKGGKDNDRLAAVYLVLTLSDWQAISSQFGVPIQEADIDYSRDDLGFWLWVLNHPELPICITEGIKKQGCLLSLGWICISVTGVWNGQVGKGKRLHKDLAPFIVPGRRVYLTFDSDILLKPSVEAALRQLGHLIKRERAEVFICQWRLDRGKGIDDLVASQGQAAFEQIIEDSISYSEWLKSLSDNSGGSGRGSGFGGSGGDGGFGGFGSGGDGDGGWDGDNQHPEAFYEPICQSLRLPFENCVTASAFDTWAYRSQFRAASGDWRVIDAAFYRWVEHLGYWEHQPDNRINSLIADFGEKAFKLKYTKEFGWQVQHPYGTNSYKESAFKYCRSRLERPEPLPVNTHLRAFKNCVVDLRTGARMPHHKNYYLTSLIPYNYEPGKECPELFRQFIIDSFGEDMLPVIRAFTSMFLDPTAPYGRFPHLVGQSGGGKGTMGRFWNSLFGEDGASSGDFSNLSTAEGRHQYLTGKSIFSIPDAGGYVSGLRAFYELVDNGGMSGRALFNPVGYFKTWNIRFWVASVDHLQIENAGDGWARRAYPIPVKARNVKPDPDLRLKLEAIKADVVSWALAMPRAERDRILLSPPENERVINLTLDSALHGDSTKSFVDLCLRPTNERGSMPHYLLHTWYVAYCKEHGYQPLGMSKFINHLKTVLPHNFVDRGWSPMINGKRSRVPAHWEYLTTVPSAFVQIDENFRDSGENPQPPTDPIWSCLKSKCLEGGLMEFEDFWNPPPNDTGDNNGGNGNSPTSPPHPLSDNNITKAPTSPKSGSTVQGGSIFAKSLEQHQIGGVQGGSIVQGIGSDQKMGMLLLEKNQVERKTLTSVEVGGHPSCELDSSKLEQNDTNKGESSDATTSPYRELVSTTKEHCCHNLIGGEVAASEGLTPLEQMIEELAKVTTSEEFWQAVQGHEEEEIENAMLLQDLSHRYQLKAWYKAPVPVSTPATSLNIGNLNSDLACNTTKKTTKCGIPTGNNIYISSGVDTGYVPTESLPTDEGVATGNASYQSGEVAMAEDSKETINYYGQLLIQGFEDGIETFKELLKPWPQEERWGAIMEFERLAPESMERLVAIAPNWFEWCDS
jgi:uncharacterized membrane protein YgcG